MIGREVRIRASRTKPGGGLHVTHGLINRLVAWSDLLIVLLVVAADPFTDGLHWPQHLVLGIVEAVVFGTLMQFHGAYRVEHYTRLLWPLGYVVWSVLGAGVVASLLLMAFAPGNLRAGGDLLPINGLLVLALALARQVARAGVGAVNRRRLLCRNTVVIGSGEHAEEVIRFLRQAPQREYHQLVGVFDEHLTPLSSTHGLEELARDNAVDEVMIGLPLSRAAEIGELVEKVQWISADVVIPFPFAEAGVQPHVARIMRMGSRAGLLVSYRPFKGSEGLLKMVEDYVVAFLGLLIASPLMLLAAVAIKMESPGPVFFRQDRTGFNNQNFRIFKFRTMRMAEVDTSAIGTQGRDDPRITKVGKFLRSSSIDELPQLINVLRGEMSVVGPQPYVPNMLVGDELIMRSIRQYAARHRIKPGITGWAQARGMRGGALRDLETARQSVEMDMYYITHWSIWFDLRIMVRTLLIGMVGKNVF